MTFVAAALWTVQVSAQADRHDVRAGNRKFRRDNWREAEISYRKALVKDSTSLAANYNLANTLYREKNYEEAAKALERVKDSASGSAGASDYWFNVGDVALAEKNYQAAVDAFRKALLADPSDLDAKENYIYARKKLEEQQKNGGGNGQNNQNDQNDQNGQGNQDNQDNRDSQNNQNDRDGKNDDNRNGQDNGEQSGGNQNSDAGQQPVKISPQQAQQMLKAVQAKEKETQDKVNREKAEALKSRQKEKNW